MICDQINSDLRSRSDPENDLRSNSLVHTICVLHKNGCYSTLLEIIERITTIKGSQVTVREALSEQFKILENSDVVGERFERCVCVVKLSHKIQVLIKFVTKKALNRPST